MAHPRIPPKYAQKFVEISYASRATASFVLNFVAMATAIGRRKKRLAAFDGPTSNPTPNRRKNLAEISYASRAIANFVPNFAAMATGVGQGKMRLAAFDGPSRKTPTGAKISQKSPAQAEL